MLALCSTAIVELLIEDIVTMVSLRLELVR